MNKPVPDPPPTPSLPHTLETQLAHISDLLRCANATVYECGDSLHGTPRDLAMASTHLITLAQSAVDHLLDHLPVTVTEGGGAEYLNA